MLGSGGLCFRAADILRKTARSVRFPGAVCAIFRSGSVISVHEAFFAFDLGVYPFTEGFFVFTTAEFCSRGGRCRSGWALIRLTRDSLRSRSLNSVQSAG